MTETNPFAARIATAAQQGYLPAKRTYARTAPALPVAPAPVSPKQIQFIEFLLWDRDLTSETRPKYQARIAQLACDHREVALLTRDAASALIEYLLTLPLRSDKHTTDELVPAGHYAVELNGILVFARIDRPEEGRWAGYTFVNLQLSDDYVRANRAQSQAILSQVRRDGFKEASIRYGKEIGRCGVCHRTLTNETSREAGIGPKCAGQMGW